VTSTHRWLIVTLGTALIIATPLALRQLPAADTDTSASALLDQVLASTNAPYSGYAEALGTLQLPVADDLAELGPLFGERTRMRVWWRGPDSWRVDHIFATGEKDFIHTVRGTTTWEYEDARVVQFPNDRARLPRVPDLLPPEIAKFLLDGVQESQVSRLPTERIVGLNAPGLRIQPTDDRSSIDHVDLWADPISGIPLRISIFDSSSDRLAMTSTFMDFTSDRPPADTTRFQPPPGASFDRPRVSDIADAANRFAPFTPPPTVAGFPRAHIPGLRSVGVYGSGLTQFFAIPLWADAARSLRAQLLVTPTVQQLSQGPVLSVGPLGLVLTEFPDGGGWLIAGTLSKEALGEVAQQLDQPSQFTALNGSP
jgi:outer membrane lipoprotein-sorting protein